MNKPSITHDILIHALPLVPFDGWTERVLREAAKKAGYGEADVYRALPGGVMDLMETWIAETDAAMEAYAATGALNDMKIRERIAALVMFRLEHLLPYREAVRRMGSHLVLPWNVPHKLRLLHRTVNLIWRLAGDQSTDYNWYTKRMLLAGVYSSTMLVWMNDNSSDLTTTRQFLARRIENVLMVGKWLGNIPRRASTIRA